MTIAPMVRPGEIYRHERFYLSTETGAYEPKYLLVLAAASEGDIVSRLLTSRPHARPEAPPCYHGHPYPGFYLGVLGGPLSSRSWLDLRGLDDLDALDFAARQKRGQITLITQVERATLRALLDCAANAEDTTRRQERTIRDLLPRLRD